MIPKLTVGGHSLMIRALAGEGLVFSKVALGNGNEPLDYYNLTQIGNSMAEVEILEYTKEEKYVKLTAVLENASLEADFSWTEVGIFVQDPDGGEDVLYAYGHYRMDGLENCQLVQKNAILETPINIYVYVGDIDDVSVVFEDPQYATKEEFRKHLDAKNPHKVSKEDVGLDKIVNAFIEDQTPVFSEKESAYSYDASGSQLNFSNIFSREKIGNIFQKIRTAINLLVKHINGKNPHKITPYSIGAAYRGIIEDRIELGAAGNDELDREMTKAFLGMQDERCKFCTYQSRGFYTKALGTNDGLMIIHRDSVKYGSAIVFLYQNNAGCKIKHRSYYNGAWTDWKEGF